MKYAVLASGSKGNSTIVSSGKTNILIDCGISKKRLNERLAICGLGITDINIVLVTHSHSDHTAGLKNFDESMQFSQLFVLGKNIPESQILCPFTKYKFGDFFVTPIPLSHDAINTTGYIIEDKNEKFSVKALLCEYDSNNFYRNQAAKYKVTGNTDTTQTKSML